jgi:hypothetical protein
MLARFLEAVALTLEKWSDGSADPGDFAVVYEAAQAVEEAIDAEVDAKLQQYEWLPGVLAMLAAIIRGVSARFVD